MAKKRILKVINSLSVEDINTYVWYDIKEEFKFRIIDLEMREPQSYGTVHDKWDDSIYYLEDIIYNMDFISGYDKEDKKEKMLNDLINDIIEYQSEYGGLYRLCIEI